MNGNEARVSVDGIYYDVDFNSKFDWPVDSMDGGYGSAGINMHCHYYFDSTFVNYINLIAILTRLFNYYTNSLRKVEKRLKRQFAIKSVSSNL